MENERKESELNQLRARERHHQEKVEYWKKQKDDADDNLRKHLEQLNAIRKRLERIEGREILLTTHMIERWQQRVGPATEEQIKAIVLTESMEKMIRTLGNGEFPIEGTGIIVVVNDHKCVTVKNGKESQEEKKQRRRGYRSKNQ